MALHSTRSCHRNVKKFVRELLIGEFKKNISKLKYIPSGFASESNLKSYDEIIMIKT